MQKLQIAIVDHDRMSALLHAVASTGKPAAKFHHLETLLPYLMQCKKALVKICQVSTYSILAGRWTGFSPSWMQRCI